MYRLWKYSQVTQEDCRDAVHKCMEKICTAEAQLELKLASAVVGHKKGFKHVNSKRKTKGNIGLLLDEVGHPTSRDEDKAQTFNIV